MSAEVPATRPHIARAKADLYLAFAREQYGAARFIQDAAVLALGVRGYYLDSMGGPGNQRGIYDDAIVVLSPAVCAAFNANTDPTVFRQDIATLVPGVHRYKPGNHGISRPGGGYPAFRPATKDEELPVIRDGVVGKSRPGVAINIHRGSNTTTSSLGCQTIPPAQWDAFYAILRGELKRAGQTVFNYVLVEETAYRAATAAA